MVIVVIKFVIILMIINLKIIFFFINVFFVLSVWSMVIFCLCLFMFVCICVINIRLFVNNISIKINLMVIDIWFIIFCNWLIWVLILNMVIDVNGLSRLVNFVFFFVGR